MFMCTLPKFKHIVDCSWYFQALAKDSGALSCTLDAVGTLSEADMPLLFAGAVVRASSATFASGSMVIAKGRDAAEAANTVAISLAVVRLPAPIAADVLLTVNAPTQIAASSQVAAHVQRIADAADNAALRAQVLATFAIRSLDIFGA